MSGAAVADMAAERAQDLRQVEHAPEEAQEPRVWEVVAHASRRVKGSKRPRVVARRLGGLVAATEEEAWRLAVVKMRDQFDAQAGWVLSLYGATSEEIPEDEADDGA